MEENKKQDSRKSNALSELFRLFFKLGVVGFGGPAAHIAMMEKEVVEKRRWLSREHFLDLLGATNLIPGPNSTEMAIHIGYHRAGIAGLLIAGVAFLIPAVFLTGLLAWIYLQYAQVPAMGGFLFGIKPAVLVLIAAALWKLGKSATKNAALGLLGLIVAGCSYFNLGEVLPLLGAGFVYALYSAGGKPAVKGAAAFALANILTPRPGYAALLVGAAASAVAVSVWQIGLFFLKIGSVLYGSGYVLVAFLEGELVQRLGWLTQAQLLDAIAIGQFTPGPVLSTATFIGYQIAGIPGAAAATLGIFAPSFIFVLLLNPVIPRLRKSKWTAGFLDGVNAGAVGLMGAVLIKLALAALTVWQAWIIVIVAAIALFKFKIGPVPLVAGSAAAGYLLTIF